MVLMRGMVYMLVIHLAGFALSQAANNYSILIAVSIGNVIYRVIRIVRR